MSDLTMTMQRRWKIRAARRLVRNAVSMLDSLLAECPIDTEIVELRGELRELDDHMTQLARDDR